MKTEFGFKNSNFGSAYLENDVIVTGDRVTNANTGFDENGQAQVNITLDMQGGRAMQRNRWKYWSSSWSTIC